MAKSETIAPLPRLFADTFPTTPSPQTIFQTLSPSSADP